MWLLFFFKTKITPSGKYFAWRDLAIIEDEFEHKIQADLDRSAVLKTCKSLKPKPPSFLVLMALLEVTICVHLLEFLFL